MIELNFASALEESVPTPHPQISACVLQSIVIEVERCTLKVELDDRFKSVLDEGGVFAKDAGRDKKGAVSSCSPLFS